MAGGLGLASEGAEGIDSGGIEFEGDGAFELWRRIEGRVRIGDRWAE